MRKRRMQEDGRDHPIMAYISSALAVPLSFHFPPSPFLLPSISKIKNPRSGGNSKPVLCAGNLSSIFGSRKGVMALKRKDGEPSLEKKRKRVGFGKEDHGVLASECINVFLVSNPDEIDAASSVPIVPVYVDQFFGEDGKIYGFKDLKINVWLNIISFSAYADITFQSKSDGGKGITDLESALQKIFGNTLMEKKEYIGSFYSDVQFISNIVSSGTVVHTESSKGFNSTSGSDSCSDRPDSTVEVIRMDLSCSPVGSLYSRLIPLILLLVEGSSPVDVTDPRWEIYFVVVKAQDQSGEFLYRLLGFTTVYPFYHYPDSVRLRISQILVLPPYQGQGHGCRLLESLNCIAISESYYDVTVEEPSDYLQHLRACIDTLRLLDFEPTHAAVTSAISHLDEVNLSKRTAKFRLDPPRDLVDAAREKLKINKKQFIRCWEILILLRLDPDNMRCVENFKVCVSNRLQGDILGKDAGTGGKRVTEALDSSGFVMFKSTADGNMDNLEGNADDEKAGQEEQLNQLVEERMREIAEVARKVLLQLTLKLSDVE